MIRFLLAIFVIIGLSSCDDIERDEPALQANVDNNFYKSNDAKAYKNGDGSMTIQGFTSDETMTLHLSGVAKRTFNIEEGSSNYALFESIGGGLYTTQPNGTGQVVVSELDEENNTVSGTFKFEAFLAGIDTVFVSKGVFFQVPFELDGIGDPSNAGSFAAKVDGDTFDPLTVTARDTGNSIVISGSAVSSTITISTPLSVEVGEYTLPTSGFSAKYQDADGSQTTNSGVINILVHNEETKTIQGTFFFETDQSEITEGSFEVVYQ